MTGLCTLGYVHHLRWAPQDTAHSLLSAQVKSCIHGSVRHNPLGAADTQAAVGKEKEQAEGGLRLLGAIL